VRLPVGVREAYQLLGRRADLMSGHGTLLPAEDLIYDHGSNILTFSAAHQNVAVFGVSLTEPTTEDPRTFPYATFANRPHVAAVEPLIDSNMSTIAPAVPPGTASWGRYTSGVAASVDDHETKTRPPRRTRPAASDRSACTAHAAPADAGRPAEPQHGDLHRAQHNDLTFQADISAAHTTIPRTDTLHACSNASERSTN
jgi:hypothetical protein